MPDFTVRYAKKSELERVNEIRYQVNRVHSNGRPDIFRDDFCDEMKNIVYKVFENEYSDVIVAVNGDTICGFATVEYIVKKNLRTVCRENSIRLLNSELMKTSAEWVLQPS